jgi:hypothetical protein
MAAIPGIRSVLWWRFRAVRERDAPGPRTRLHCRRRNGSGRTVSRSPAGLASRKLMRRAARRYEPAGRPDSATGSLTTKRASAGRDRGCGAHAHALSIPVRLDRRLDERAPGPGTGVFIAAARASRCRRRDSRCCPLCHTWPLSTSSICFTR